MLAIERTLKYHLVSYRIDSTPVCVDCFWHGGLGADDSFDSPQPLLGLRSNERPASPETDPRAYAQKELQSLSSTRR